ncbi:hypothetical protein EC973_001598 [Apophysomyces ossiformis]|uniref:Phospholipid-transporting ATPase n=1 Tax=Apophysomyces ossiformis TaxID=679940 RepID=A0A8H7BTG7_9FUNG|nr:hypothetical protein EC973_001598 [Apophysomyces ossiformis]
MKVPYHFWRWSKGDTTRELGKDEHYEEIASHRTSSIRRSNTTVKLRRIPTGGRRVFVNLPLPAYEINKHGQPRNSYVSNKIRTSKYTLLSFLPKNLFEQFRRAANLYFLGMAILQMLPYFGVKSPALTLLPICCVVGITAIKDGFEDYQRHKVDARFNNTITHTLLGYKNANYPTAAADKLVTDDSNESPSPGVFGRSLSMDVRVGDFILLRNGDNCPADAVLLSSSEETGVCFVESKDLDGETNLKPRHGIPDLTYIQSGTDCFSCHCYIESGAPGPDLYSFDGTLVLLEKSESSWKEKSKVPVTIDNLLLRGHVIRTKWAIAVVLFTGTDSKIMLNSGETPSKRSHVEKEMNQEVLIAFVVLFVLCFICAAMGGVMKQWDDRSPAWLLYSRQSGSPAFVGFTNFWASLIIFQNIIPISLYVSIEFVKTFQAYFIWNDRDMWDDTMRQPCIPKSWNLSDDLGQIEYIFSDKTGTLTRNVMEFRECSIGGTRYGNNGFAPESEGARGARLRRERQSDTHDEMQASNNTAAYEEQRLAIFHDYQDALLSTFEPRYSSLDRDRLSFADPRIFSDLKDPQRQQIVREFFMLLALCHTVVVERIGKDGKVLIEESEESQSTDTQPQVVENNLAFEEKSQKFREVLREQKKRLKRHLKQKTANKRRSRGEEFESITNASRSSLVDHTVKEQLEYKAESPDEAALVSAARNAGFSFVSRRGKDLTVDFLGEEYSFELLNVLEFNSTRKRMSVILRRPAPWNDIVLYCKGADNVIFERLDPSEQVEETQKDVDTYSKDGLRTLVLAWRRLDEAEYEAWNQQAEEASTAIEDRAQKVDLIQDKIERNLKLLGATGIEDKLQEGVPQCIEDLRHAGIKVWVLTGDKMETAINIGYASNLLEANMKLWTVRGSDKEHILKNLKVMNEKLIRTEENALIIEGGTLTQVFLDDDLKAELLEVSLLCKSVICCRVSPLQKALVVDLVKSGVGAITLAVGDGANDVSMIQAANVGIGIAGKEGVQASMASDYAIGQFRFLNKLLLVQGHWSYERISEMILNFFFKNVFWVFPSLWYQIYSRFSGNIFYDYSFLQLYNVIFTVAPVVVLGATDQDITAPYLNRYPQSYEIGIHRCLYTKSRFWIYFADGVWQSLVVFYAFYFLYGSDPNPNGHPESMLQFSTSVAVTCIVLANIMPGFNTYYWTWFQFFFVSLEILVTFLWVVIYGLFPTSIQGMAHMVFGAWSFWMTFFLAVVVAFLPRFTITFVRQWWFPDVIAAVRHAELDDKRKKKHM